MRSTSPRLILGLGLHARHYPLQDDDYALLEWLLGRTSPAIVTLEHGGTEATPEDPKRNDPRALEEQLRRLRGLISWPRRDGAMPDLMFVPMDETGLSTYAAWFEDAELRRRLEVPARRWFDHVRHEPGCRAWMIYEEDVAVGHLQLDTDPDGMGSIALVVNPELRDRGYGRRILRALRMRPEAAQLRRIEATVEPDNAPAARCLKAAGFELHSPEPDEEGCLRFVCIMKGNI